jgi:pyroglutamyl-peptidase
MMRRVLVTGFEPFNEHAVNPSQTIAERLSGSIVGDVNVVGLTLPVEWGKDTELMFSAISDVDPVAIISLGLDATAQGLKVEMFAINHRIVAEDQTLEPIVPDGPAAYFATVDVDRVGKAMGKQACVPVIRHGYAGSYLCNHIFYQTLHHTHLQRSRTKVGFIHIPFADDAVNTDLGRLTLPIDRMIAAVRVAVQEAVVD